MPVLVLAFDTSASGLSATLWQDGEALADHVEAITHGQAEALMPALEGLMEKGGVEYSALDLIAVTVGPGSFTGVRVGLATARALGLAAGVPVQGLITTEAVAWGVSEDERAGRAVVVVMDSRRADLFVQIFDEHLAPLCEPQAMAPQDVIDLLPQGPLVLAGDAAHMVIIAERDVRQSSQRLPHTPSMARLAVERIGRPGALGTEPIYIRPPDAKLPKHGGRLRP